MLKRIGDLNSVLGSGDPTYSASSIVGQTLIAKTAVTTYDEPYDNANAIGSYAPGSTVGVVTSWEDADPSDQRSVLYWQFEDANGNPYYAPHYEGEFDVQALADAGVLTTAQQTQAAADASKSTITLEFEKYAPWVIGGLLAVLAIGVVLKSKK